MLKVVSVTPGIKYLEKQKESLQIFDYSVSLNVYLFPLLLLLLAEKSLLDSSEELVVQKSY